MLPNKHSKLEIELKSTKEDSGCQSPSHKQEHPSIMQANEKETNTKTLISSEIRTSQ